MCMCVRVYGAVLTDLCPYYCACVREKRNEKNKKRT